MPVHTGGGHHALVQCGHQLGLHSEWHYVAPGLAGARGGLMCSGSGTGFRCTPRPHSHGCRRTGAAGIIVSQAHSHDILVAMLASVHAPFCHYPGYTVGITAVFAPSLLPQSRPTRSESRPYSPLPCCPNPGLHGRNHCHLRLLPGAPGGRPHRQGTQDGLGSRHDAGRRSECGGWLRRLRFILLCNGGTASLTWTTSDCSGTSSSPGLRGRGHRRFSGQSNGLETTVRGTARPALVGDGWTTVGDTAGDRVMVAGYPCMPQAVPSSPVCSLMCFGKVAEELRDALLGA